MKDLCCAVLALTLLGAIGLSQAQAQEPAMKFLAESIFLANGDVTRAGGFEQRGGKWYAMTERGSRSEIVFEFRAGRMHMVAPDWAGLKGELELLDHTIRWNDGTTWISASSPYMRKYYVDGRRALVARLGVDGHEPYAMNEKGDKTRIRWLSATEFEALDWKVKGTLRLNSEHMRDGIAFDNGTFWCANWFTAVFYVEDKTPAIKGLAGKPIVINERGMISRMRWNSTTEVTALDWDNLTGVITDRGVAWRNGTFWSFNPPGQ